MENKKITSDWVFFNLDKSAIHKTIEIDKIPSLGDGKVFDNRGYEVKFIANNLISNSNPVIFAIQIN